ANQIAIKTKTLYPGYDFDNLPILHDLAIVELSSIINFGSKLNAISIRQENSCCLTALTTTYQGQTLKVDGYGLDQNVNITSQDPIALATSLAKPLIQTRLKTYSSVALSDTDCSSKIASVANLGTGTPFDSALLVGVTNQMICLNSVSGSGACFIDNGGPMINSEGKLVGVLGLLLNCGDPASVTVGNELSGEHLIWAVSQSNFIDLIVEAATKCEQAVSQSNFIDLIVEAATNWVQTLFSLNRGPERIMGGSTITFRTKSPYSAYIAIQPIDFIILNKYIRFPLCTASILTTTKLITGASCFKVFESMSRVAVIGALKALNTELGTLQMEIKDTKMYPGYDFDKMPLLHDLAIVEIYRTINFGIKWNAITLRQDNNCCLNSATTTYEGETLMVHGYDPMALASSLAIPLIQSRLKSYSEVALSDTSCSSKIASVANLGTGTGFDSALLAGVSNQLICLSPTSGSGPCFMDNGAPMMNSAGQLVGVLSLLLNCGDPESLTVGNELSGDHLTWVKQQTGL
ncbi:unnamed protein product, partial [Notodromas monacha]